MFFILSKLLIYFLYPLSWIFALLLITFLIKNKRHKRYTSITAFVLLLIFSNNYLFKQFVTFWDFPRIPTTNMRYSCAVILGGYVSEDAAKNGYFNGAADRYIQAIKLKETGKAAHLLFTGGNASLDPDGFTETNWLQSELKIFNFPDSTLLFEKQSRNTIENISFSKKILETKHLQPPYLLVTSAFHMRRALLICKKANLHVVPYPCDFSGGITTVSFDDFIPSTDALHGWSGYLKELVGYTIVSFKS